MSNASKQKKPVRGGRRKGAGRPALPPGEVRTVRLAIRLTHAESNAIAGRADSDNLTVAEWVRLKLLG